MQSDLRDLYQSVRLIGFGRDNSSEMEQEKPIVAELAMQLSDNDEQRHLLAVFQEYLRANNYSVGGTELFAEDNGRMDVYGEYAGFVFRHQ